ncbi:MAG: helix-turn-helix transcriptional regulator [Pseudomonadota bacterium]
MVALPVLLTPAEMGDTLAARCRELRLFRNWSRGTLAKRAGVTVASLKRFEIEGKASLELLLRVAHALGRLDEFASVLLPPRAQSVAELEEQVERPRRRRGRS